MGGPTRSCQCDCDVFGRGQLVRFCIALSNPLDTTQDIAHPWDVDRVEEESVRGARVVLTVY